MSDFEGRGLSCVRGERLVFRDLAFALPRGGALVLTGPNGSGKSSLLRLMAGLLPPESGTLTWGDTPVADDPAAHRERVSYLGHLDAVKPVLSALENLTFWAGLGGAGRTDVLRALDGFGLAPLAELPGRVLSAGQRRRLALARLLLVPTKLWLLDEPSVGLDRDSLARLEAACAGHRARGGRIAVATHATIDLPDAHSLDLAAFAVPPASAFAARAAEPRPAAP